jgi:predicted LPLAT superfamily acyltransferase
MNGRPAPNSPWLEQPERGSRGAMRLMKWLALNCGRRAARLLLVPVCAYFLLFSPRARLASRGYLARALGRPLRIADLWRHYFSFAATVLDRVYLLAGRLERFDIEMRGLDALEAALAQGKGCLLVGAHLGSFELLRAVGLLQKKHPVNVVMYEDNAANISGVLDDLNPEVRPRIIVPGELETALRIGECLARGEVVGMLGDRRTAPGKPVMCPFFGRDAAFPAGPLQLAQGLRVPVLLFFGLYRGGNRYLVHFETFCEEYPGERAAREAWVRGAVARYAARLEHFCRLAPYNWFNFYDFWKRPDA